MSLVWSLMLCSYSPGDIYRILQGAIAKPILSLQDDIVDDLTPEITIKDLGLLVRAPVAAVATIPFILTAGVWVLVPKVCAIVCISHPVISSSWSDNKVPLRPLNFGKCLSRQDCQIFLG